MGAFLAELELTVRAGHGGAGSVHFARRKYQPFGGPDGGDGGDGGSVILAGDRGLDSLDHLRNVKPRGQDGGPGGPNLRSGRAGEDCPLGVPLGTIARCAAAGESEHNSQAAVA